MGSIRRIVEEFRKLREDLIPGVTFDEYKYKEDHISTDKEIKERQVFIGEAIRLLVDLELRNGTKEEGERLTKYFWILMEAAKEGLDFRKAREDLGILALKEKYSVTVRDLEA